jgi:hypothetical protein
LYATWRAATSARDFACVESKFCMSRARDMNACALAPKLSVDRFVVSIPPDVRCASAPISLSAACTSRVDATAAFPSAVIVSLIC